MNAREPSCRHSCGGRPECRRALPVLLLLASVAIAACRQPTQLAPAEGGLARGDAARLSLLVAQTRAQHPELSAKVLKQGPQETADQGAQLAELALVGEGVGLSPGIQVGPRETIRLSLYLDKSRYHAGHATLSFGAGPEQTWRIISYDLRGQVAGDFELLFALADAQSRVRYLAVLGAAYEEQDRKLLAYEGTLILPGAGVRIEDWERIYKIDFGYRHPAEPLYLAGVARAEALFAALRRAVSSLETQRQRIAQARLERDALARESPPPENAQRHERELERRAQAIGEMEAQRDRAAQEAEDTLVRYWATRASIDADFARFLDSNPYRWRAPEQQQAWFGQWKQVEFHHPRIDGLQSALAEFLPDRTAIDQAREKAIAEIDRLNNWAKNPARAGDPRR